MNLTSRQVADKLGVHVSTVRIIGKQGKLGELIQTGNGTKKQHFLYNSKNVNEYIQNNKPVRKVKTVTQTVSEPSSTTTNGIMSRLDRIETKLDKLIKLWS